MMDVLGDVLRALRLRGSVYFNACFCAPWGMQLSSDSKASFHIVVKGNAWLKMATQEQAIKLSQGDIVLFPTSAAHVISDSLDSDCIAAEEVVFAYQNQQPLFEAKYSANNAPIHDQTDFHIVCGYVELDRSISHPFLDNLPELIHIDSQWRARFQWLDSVIRQIVLETAELQPASAVLIDRFTEILFIQVIRSYAQLSANQQSYFSAIQDKQLSKALSLMHTRPDQDWSIELLAAEIGMSRSAFYARFNDYIGIAPMKYLFQWRMLQAKQKIETSQKSLSTVAEEVGYQSDSAFQKAFKRFFSYTPASLRKKSE